MHLLVTVVTGWVGLSFSLLGLWTIAIVVADHRPVRQRSPETIARLVAPHGAVDGGKTESLGTPFLFG